MEYASNLIIPSTTKLLTCRSLTCIKTQFFYIQIRTGYTSRNNFLPAIYSIYSSNPLSHTPNIYLTHLKEYTLRSLSPLQHPIFQSFAPLCSSYSLFLFNIPFSVKFSISIIRSSGFLPSPPTNTRHVVEIPNQHSLATFSARLKLLVIDITTLSLLSHIFHLDFHMQPLINFYPHFLVSNSSKPIINQLNKLTRETQAKPQTLQTNKLTKTGNEDKARINHPISFLFSSLLNSTKTKTN